MTVHHLNCGTMCPVGARMTIGGDRLVCHCLVAETNDGLVLVDTGFGLGDVHNPKRLGRPFLAVTRPKLEESETALRQIEKLGFSRGDVRHICVTHLDLDHAGALGDFPDAEVHLTKDEHQGTERWDPRHVAAHWAHGPKWRLHSVEGDRWLGFDAVRAIADDVLLIPLYGHSRGHAGVAVKLGDRWLLHAGDAYFHRAEMDLANPRCPPGLRAFQTLAQFDKKKRLENQQRLRELIRDHGDTVRVFSAHDPTELSHAQNQS
jgi:glyoxylase-like metal-dependent hydrolase (beta-lactamase superfamily II)